MSNFKSPAINQYNNSETKLPTMTSQSAVRNDSLSSNMSNKVARRIKLRWIIFIIVAVEMFMLITIKTSLSLSIVAMVSNVTCTIDGATGKMSEGCYESEAHREHHIPWNEMQKNRLLQAYIWGSMGMAIFGGRISEIYGPRLVTSLAIAIIGLINLGFPFLAQKSYWFAYFARLTQGICSAAAVPSNQVILARWATQHEKTIANSIIISGALFGNALTPPMVGLLVSSDFLGGWPSVFYMFGALSVFIAIAWFLLIRDDPGQHPLISQDELTEIIQHRTVKKGKVTNLPWVSMLTSPAIYAILLANFAYSWNAGFFSLQLSSFYKNVLQVSYKSNGVMTALPYIVSIATNYLAGFLMDWLRKSEILSTGKLRKIAAFIGYGASAGCLCLIPLVGPHIGTVVILATIAKGFGALNTAGPSSNHLDICPTYAGTFIGISRTCQDLSQILMTESVAWLVGNQATPQRWYNTFYFTATLTILGALIFIVLGSGEIQPWDPAYRKVDDNQPQIIIVDAKKTKKPEMQVKIREESKY